MREQIFPFLEQTLADNDYLCGEFSLADVPMMAVAMVLEVDGTVVSLGAGAACLGHPLNAEAWLAKTMVSRGHALKAGQVILTGALGPMISLKPGQQIKSSIGGLGSVSFSCSSE